MFRRRKLLLGELACYKVVVGRFGILIWMKIVSCDRSIYCWHVIFGHNELFVLSFRLGLKCHVVFNSHRFPSYDAIPICST